MVSLSSARSVVTITGTIVKSPVYEDNMTKKERKDKLENSDYVKQWIKTKWIFVQWRETDKWECLGENPRMKDFMWGEFYGSSDRPATIKSPFIQSVKIITPNTREEAQCQMK